jgi:hypothetical protein
MRDGEKKMPVVRNLSLEINEEDVFRRQDIRDSARVRPSMKAMTLELLKKKNDYLSPVVAYEIYRIIDRNSDYITLSGGTRLSGRTLVSLLGQALEVAVILCTIGPRLETRAEQYFHYGESLKGFLLDGMGSAAIDSIAVQACAVIKSEAASRGLSAGGPLSPGMFGWDIKELTLLLKLAPAKEIGLGLTSGGMMSPRKSLAMVIGLGLDLPFRSEMESCNYCNLKETCRQRR